MRAPVSTLIQMPLFNVVYFYYGNIISCSVPVLAAALTMVTLLIVILNTTFFWSAAVVTLFYINIYFGFFGHPEVYYFNITCIWCLFQQWFLTMHVAVFLTWKVCVCNATIVFLASWVWAHHIVYWLVWM